MHVGLHLLHEPGQIEPRFYWDTFHAQPSIATSQPPTCKGSNHMLRQIFSRSAVVSPDLCLGESTLPFGYLNGDPLEYM